MYYNLHICLTLIYSQPVEFCTGIVGCNKAMGKKESTFHVTEKSQPNRNIGLIGLIVGLTISSIFVLGGIVLFIGIPQLEQNNAISATATAQVYNAVATQEANTKKMRIGSSAYFSCVNKIDKRYQVFVRVSNGFTVELDITCLGGIINTVQPFPAPISGTAIKNMFITQNGDAWFTDGKFKYKLTVLFEYNQSGKSVHPRAVSFKLG